MAIDQGMIDGPPTYIAHYKLLIILFPLHDYTALSNNSPDSPKLPPQTLLTVLNVMSNILFCYG